MSDESPAQEPGQAHEHEHEHGATRRQVLQAGSAILLGAVVLSRPGVAGAAPVSAASLAGTDPFVAAMHVHACYSEGTGSREAHKPAAGTPRAQLLSQTDPDITPPAPT